MATDNFGDNVMFIRGVRIDNPDQPDEYPYRIPAVRAMDSMSFDQPITFLVGENGSGKSTILEAMAVEAGFNAEGGTKNYRFETRGTTSSLAQNIRLVRGIRREQDGFFLRAESFYNVATESERNGSGTIHNQSHGESFMGIANDRFGPNSLFFLDEPEAALSPQRQLAWLLSMGDLAALGSQFIVATHSPILLAYPGAAIYKLSSEGVELVEYEETDHFKLTKDFLENYRAYTKHIFNPDL